MLNVHPSGREEVKLSLSVLASAESLKIAVITVKPSFLRTSFQVLGSTGVTDRVVPEWPGCSLPSATIVSVLWTDSGANGGDPPGPKSKTYLFGPAASTFIWSVCLLLRASSFHFPTNGSLAALKVPMVSHAVNNRRVGLNTRSSCAETRGSADEGVWHPSNMISHLVLSWRLQSRSLRRHPCAVRSLNCGTPKAGRRSTAFAPPGVKGSGTHRHPTPT